MQKKAVLQANTDIARADGVIVLGNNRDIDPERYKAERHKETKSEMDKDDTKARALYEYALIEAAKEGKVPYFGVCGGMQRLNVALGGTLIQHVPDWTGNNEHVQKEMHEPGKPYDAGKDVPLYIPVQRVEVIRGTQLAADAKGVTGLYTPTRDQMLHDQFMENSMHHQAVDKVASGFRVSAQSVEHQRPGVHIIEAIEVIPDGQYAGWSARGVQWHPEFIASDVSLRVMDNFFLDTKNHLQGVLLTSGHARENAHPSEAMEYTIGSLGGDIRANMKDRGYDWVTRVKQTPRQTTR